MYFCNDQGNGDEEMAKILLLILSFARIISAQTQILSNLIHIILVMRIRDEFTFFRLSPSALIQILYHCNRHQGGLTLFMLCIQGRDMEITVNEKLWKVFCVHNMLVGIALITVLHPVYLSLSTISVPLLITIISAALFAWLAWSVFVFCQCAFSCSWISWGYSSRENIILVMISAVAGAINLVLG